MAQLPIDADKLVQHWIAASAEDYDTMSLLYRSGKYTWCLFIGHLMLEKLLKACFIRRQSEAPPFIHNLSALAEKAGLSPDESQRLALATITAFNINARYDDYKKSFHNRCTPEYTAHWINQIEEIRSWIQKQLAE